MVRSHARRSAISSVDDLESESVSTKIIGNTTVYAENYSSLQAAIDAAPPGGTVQIPPSIDVFSTVKITREHNGISLVGGRNIDRNEPRVINSQITDGSNVVEIDNTNGQVEEITVRGIGINGNGQEGDGWHFVENLSAYRAPHFEYVAASGVGGNGFYISESYQGEFWCLFANDNGQHGIVCDYDNSGPQVSLGNHFVRPWSAVNAQDGIVETTANGWHVHNIWDHPVCPFNTRDGMRVCGYSRIRDPHMEDNGRYGLHVDGSPLAGGFSAIAFIDGGDISGEHDYGIRFNDTLGGGFNHVDVTGAVNAQVELTDAQDVAIGNPPIWEKNNDFDTTFYSIDQSGDTFRLRPWGETQVNNNLNNLSDADIAGRTILNNTTGTGSTATLAEPIRQTWTGSYYRPESEISGNYTGDGTQDRTISLGFRPNILTIEEGTTGNVFQLTDDGVAERSDATTPAGRFDLADNGFIVGDNAADENPNSNGVAYYFRAE